jgi:DNA invertase Pin-like site-specific DNA recombinase
MSSDNHILIPKIGDVLQVIALGRISTVHQDAENIEASFRYIQEFLSRIYRGKLDIQFLGEQASGMSTERATILAAEERVASGLVDLVIAEDLSRIYRNPRHQYRFVQDAVDRGTRVICVGDGLDTADENWEIMMGAASLRHGLHIPDTRRRVRRTATHSFHKGGMVQKIRYGYRKLTKEEAASAIFGSKDLRIAKVPECTPVIQDMLRRVLAGESYAAIADHLNAQRIEPGPYVSRGRWSPRVLVDLLEDPILTGVRTFRDTICRPIFKTGRHKSGKNSEPEIERYPELAHLTAAGHEALLAAIALRRTEYLRPTGHGSRRGGVARSRSFWPGQAITCAICGGLFHYSGKHLRCSRSLPRNGALCWCGVQVPTHLVRIRFVDWLISYLKDKPTALAHFVDIVWPFLQPTVSIAVQSASDEKQLHALERQAANLTQAIAEGGRLATLVARLQIVETEIVAARKAAKVLQLKPKAITLTKAQIGAGLPELINKLMETSFEFAAWLRRFVPSFVIQPVQALDTPLVRPRGLLNVRLDLLGDEEDPERRERVQGFPVTLDLFDPPIHIRAIPACSAVRTTSPGLSGRRIAMQLDLNPMTVKRATDYAKRMAAEGLVDPYRAIHTRPAAVSRWRKRRNASSRKVAI